MHLYMNDKFDLYRTQSALQGTRKLHASASHKKSLKFNIKNTNKNKIRKVRIKIKRNA